MSKNKKHDGPKVLFLDIETSPIIAHVWALFDQNVALNQIVQDWSILSWSAKWMHEDKIMYQDVRHEKDVNNDKNILKGIWELLDEADIVIGHNSKRFDIKKLNARFVLNGMQPPSSFKQIDTLTIAKKHFAMTSNKLEYLADKLGVKYKKLKSKKFPGHSLWTQCLAHNMNAWKEMESYNKHDVLALEGVYDRLQAWDNTIDFNLYREACDVVCNCGSTSFLKRGPVKRTSGWFDRLRCNKCGSETYSKIGPLSPEKKKSLRKRGR